MAKFCEKCGSPLNPQTGRCPVCDSAPVSGGIPKADVPLERPAPSTWKKRTARFCSCCGGPTDPQTGYCTACGVMSRYTRMPPPQQKKKRHTALWIVTIAAVLLAAAATVGVLEHFRIVNIPVVRRLEERMGIRPYAEEIYDENGVLQGYEARKNNGDYFQYDAAGALECYGVGKYDAAGQLIELCHYNDAGALQRYDDYKYSTSGELVGIYSYDGGGNLIGIYSHS